MQWTRALVPTFVECGRRNMTSRMTAVEQNTALQGVLFSGNLIWHNEEVYTYGLSWFQFGRMLLGPVRWKRMETR
jgi:hypothetical protein